MTSTSETRLICMVSKSVFLISTSKSSFYLNLPFLASMKFYALTVTLKTILNMLMRVNQAAKLSLDMLSCSAHRDHIAHQSIKPDCTVF